MDAETPRGENAANIREATVPSGWVTTAVAARSLDVSPRTVRWHIERGNLIAKAEGEGVRRSWLVSIDSLQALRDSRMSSAQSPGGYRVKTGDAETSADVPGNAIRELADRLVEEAAKASEFRVRLELSERAESTVRAELAEERQRREEAEREREDLRRELDALRQVREAPETVEEEPEGAQPRFATTTPQTSSQSPQRITLRGLRRRLLGW
jgi:hypothetical protein